MLNFNYHTHTYRCGHATGTDEQYVLSAIGAKMNILGFSDHIMLPNVSQKLIRGDYSSLDDYVRSINQLKEKYKERIKIHVGFEAEAFKPFYNYYRKLITNGDIEYLILGNHYDMDPFKNISSNFLKIDNDEDLYRYRDLAIEAMSTGLFSYFAHPDYFMYSIDKFNNSCKDISKDIIHASIKYDCPLEINIGGIKAGKLKIGNSYRYHYPTVEFFKLASKMHAKCIIGVDAHSPETLLDESLQYEAIKFANDLNLNLIDKLNFKKIV